MNQKEWNILKLVELVTLSRQLSALRQLCVCAQRVSKKYAKPRRIFTQSARQEEAERAKSVVTFDWLREWMSVSVCEWMSVGVTWSECECWVRGECNFFISTIYEQRFDAPRGQREIKTRNILYNATFVRVQGEEGEGRGSRLALLEWCQERAF